MADESVKEMMKRYLMLERTDPAAAKRFFHEHQDNKKFVKIIELKTKLVPAMKAAMLKRADSINAALNEDEQFRKPMLDSILEDVKDEVKKTLPKEDQERVSFGDIKVNTKKA